MKPYIVYTKTIVGHKVYAETEEDAIKAWKNGEEVDSFENDEEFDSIVEY